MTVGRLLQLGARKTHYSVAALLTVALAGLGARIWLAVMSDGSGDLYSWMNFAGVINQYSVAFMYQIAPEFNHPPLMGYLAGACLRIAQALGLAFPFVFKLPMIGADIIVAALLWNIWNRRRGPTTAALAVAAFALSLVSILMTSYHGNTDSLCAMLCLLSAYLIDRKWPLAAGLALAAALNVKLLPLILVPAFGLLFRSWRDMLRFGIGLSLALVPFLPFLACCGSNVYRNAITYNSNTDHWGIMLFLLLGADNPAFSGPAGNAIHFYYPRGRYIIMGSILVLSFWNYWKHRWNAFEMGSICFAMFLIFTPGFGIQYLVYLCPLLFAVSLRWAALYSTLAGIFAASVFYASWNHSVPFSSIWSTRFPMPTPLFGLLAWMVLIQFVMFQLRRPETVDVSLP